MDTKPQIHHLTESERGCGYRKAGKDGVGLYLIGQGLFQPCERLPMPLDVCPTCGAGIHFSRGFTWIDPWKLFAKDAEPVCNLHRPDANITDLGYHNHMACPMCNPAVVGDKAGLLWVGHQHYKRPQDFTLEAHRMGVSKRIAAVPNGFKIGEHWVYLAHKKAVEGQDEPSSGIFTVFKPAMLDLVIDDPDNIPEKALNLLERHENSRLVKVWKDAGEQQSVAV